MRHEPCALRPTPDRVLLPSLSAPKLPLYHPLMRPTWAEVSRSALQHNFATIQQHAAPATVCAIVKANAYGHGLVECARTFQDAGAEWFGVTGTEEGVQLREAGIRGRILLMTGFWRGEHDDVIDHRLTPAI